MKNGNRLILFAAILGWIALAGCGKQQSTEGKHYSLEGEILSVDVPSKVVFVKHGDIPGYMEAMSMGYPVRDAKELEGLKEGDKIRADLVVEDGLGHLEKIAVTSKAPATSTTPAPASPDSKK